MKKIFFFISIITFISVFSGVAQNQQKKGEVVYPTEKPEAQNVVKKKRKSLPRTSHKLVQNKDHKISKKSPVSAAVIKNPKSIPLKKPSTHTGDNTSVFDREGISVKIPSRKKNAVPSVAKKVPEKIVVPTVPPKQSSTPKEEWGDFVPLPESLEGKPRKKKSKKLNK